MAGSQQSIAAHSLILPYMLKASLSLTVISSMPLTLMSFAVRVPGSAQSAGLTYPLVDIQGRCNQDPNARSLTIMITDSCPECEADHLDLQASSCNFPCDSDDGALHPLLPAGACPDQD